MRRRGAEIDWLELMDALSAACRGAGAASSVAVRRHDRHRVRRHARVVLVLAQVVGQRVVVLLLAVAEDLVAAALHPGIADQRVFVRRRLRACCRPRTAACARRPAAGPAGTPGSCRPRPGAAAPAARRRPCRTRRARCADRTAAVRRSANAPSPTRPGSGRNPRCGWAGCASVAGSKMPPMPSVVLTRKRPSACAACFGLPCSSALTAVTGWPRLLKKLPTPSRTGRGTTAT